MSEKIADGTVEIPIDWEARAIKAEAKIVDLKKSTKETPEEDIEPKVEVKAEIEAETKTFGEQDIEKILEKRDFYKNNPEMSEHKEAIEKYIANGGISLEQAKILVMQDDPTINARQNTSNANFTDGQAGFSKKSYSQEDLYNLGQKSPALKRQAMELISSGQAIETV